MTRQKSNRTATVSASTPPPSLAVIETIARHEGVDPTELTTRLSDVIDPDALDVLFSTGSDSSRPGEVTFEYHGYRVIVAETGEVRATELTS